MEATVIRLYELSGAGIYADQLGLDIAMADAKGFCHLHLFSFFALVLSQMARMESRNWGMHCLV